MSNNDVMNPYLPDSIHLPNYHEAVLGPVPILGTFFALNFVLLVVAWLLATHLPMAERWIVVWMLNTGVIHLIVEGSYVLNKDFYTNANPALLLLELWKEYAKADSRYATGDAFVFSLEAFTSFVVGPLCLVAAGGCMIRAAWRWMLIALLSCCQAYGTVLYFGTSWVEGNAHVRPEPLYFWFYYVTMNSIWILAPCACIWKACAVMIPAVQQMQAKSKRA